MSEFIYSIIGVVLIVVIGLGMAYLAAYSKTIVDYYSEDDVIKENHPKPKAEKHEPKNAARNKGKAILKARRQGHLSAFWHGERYGTGLYNYSENGK